VDPVTAPLADLTRVVPALIASTLAGWAVVRSMSPGLTRRERFAWSLGVGLLVQALCLAALFAAGATPRGSSLLVGEAIVGGLALVLGRRTKTRAFARTGRAGAATVVLAFVAAAAWLIFLGISLADGMWTTDFLAIWGYKGKLAFFTSGLPRRLFDDPALDFAHREYPLLVPLSFSALAAWIGRWNDRALALFYPACSLATLLAISGFLERRASRLSAGVGTALAALCYVLYRPASVGTAEIPLALGVLLATSAASDFLAVGGGSSVARLASASLFCASTKPEGTLFALLLASLLAVRSAGAIRSRIAAVAALTLPAVTHAVALRTLTRGTLSRDFDFHLLEPSHWGELASRFGATFSRIFEGSVAGAWLPLLAIAVFLAATRRGAADPLIPVFLGAVFLYIVACALSAFGPAWAVDAAFARIVLTLFPAFTLVLGARFPSGPGSVGREPDRPPSRGLAAEA